MKNCKYCGCEFSQDSKFCAMCGSPVEDDDYEETIVLNSNDDDWGETVVLSEEKPFESDNSYYTPAGSIPNINSAFVNPYYQNNGNAQNNAEVQGFVPQDVEQPSLKNCYIKFWKNYTNFSGRARRSEYWYVVLANVLVSLVSMIPYVGPVIGGLYTIAVLVPTLALMVRRLHDLGKDWYYIFFALIPLAGQIILLVWFCTDSQVGTNEFGENPKGIN